MKRKPKLLKKGRISAKTNERGKMLSQKQKEIDALARIEQVERLAASDKRVALGKSEYSIDGVKTVKTTTPRLLAAARGLNIGKNTMLEFLRAKGYSVQDSPAYKLTADMYVELVKQFRPEKLKEVFEEEEGTKNETEAWEIVLKVDEHGKIRVFQQFPDGSLVVANGVSSALGIFLPYFTSTTVMLSELEGLINSPNVLEDELQKFIERYLELILGEDYKQMIPQASITIDEHSWEADFALIPHNQAEFGKLLELKLPRQKVHHGEKNGHMHLSAKLHSAIQQLKDYSKALNNPTTRKKFREKYGTDLYRPQMQLIIGRKGEFQLHENYLDFQAENGIKVTDWDTFYETQKRKYR